MSNFYLSSDAINGETVRFSNHESHHLRRVLRHCPGDEVTAVDGCGHWFLIQLTAVSNTEVSGRILRQRENVGEPSIRVALAQALPKNQKMDLTLEKGTEVGISEFIPFISERTIKQREDIPARWSGLVMAAMKQCGRSRLPAIQPICTSAQLIERFARYERVLFAHPAAENISVALTASSGSALVIIGPEGGFSSPEVTAFQQAGARGFSLGERILRTETAGLVVAALLIYGAGKS